MKGGELLLLLGVLLPGVMIIYASHSIYFVFLVGVGLFM